MYAWIKKKDQKRKVWEKADCIRAVQLSPGMGFCWPRLWNSILQTQNKQQYSLIDLNNIITVDYPSFHLLYKLEELLQGHEL